jgi:hypothetical protein
MRSKRVVLVALAALASFVACKPAKDVGEEGAKVHACGEKDKVHTHDAQVEGATAALVPCSASGANDYSGVVKVESTFEGVKITIDATDDQVDMGALGSDVKTRDAVLVYPKGKGSKAVEVALVKTLHGYMGEKVIPWVELDKLTDEGTKIDVAIFDHDKKGEASEELHVAVAVSTGKSCEKARDENNETVDLGAKGGAPQQRDFTEAELGAPMKTDAFFRQCGLDAKSSADICVAVKQGKPFGVSVSVSPVNNKVAACIDRAARKLRFPSGPRLDIVKQHF